MSDTEFEGIVESPWSGGASPFAINSKKLGMWLFIVSDSLTFSALLISYAYVRLEMPNWPRPFEIWPAIAKSSLMTFVLLSSSLTMVLGVNAAFNGDRKKTVRYLIATIVCGLLFVGFTPPSGSRSSARRSRRGRIPSTRLLRFSEGLSMVLPASTCCTSPSA